jgi:NADH:ubiquinone oxidoreductase subunit 6 (subunit J)
MAPWLYVGTVFILFGITQITQRHKGKAWEWPFAVVIGFGIAMIAWIVAIGLVNNFAPGQVVPG